jgi:hypothetical protein
MQQYHRMKAEHPDALLFFRMGDFYELFFEDAVVASRALEIALTSRAKERDGTPIPMCGVPHHAGPAYVARLVKQGFRVALCEQMEDPRSAKGVVRREVVRVVTPATQLEASALEAGENSYVLALSPAEASLGAAWLDATTGEFFVSEWEGPARWERLRDEIGALRPREILLPRSAQLPSWLDDVEQPEGAIPRSLLEDPEFDARTGRRDLLAHFQAASLEAFGCERAAAGDGCGGSRARYVRSRSEISATLSVCARARPAMSWFSTRRRAATWSWSKTWPTAAARHAAPRPRSHGHGHGLRRVRDWISGPQRAGAHPDRLDAVESWPSACWRAGGSARRWQACRTSTASWDALASAAPAPAT